MLMIGPSQNIAARGFDQAQGMIRLDPQLERIFKIQDHLKTITRRKTGTKLDVKTFDTKIVTGEIPLLTIIDEVHELGPKAAGAAVMQQVRGGGITMKGGQLLMLTTQSYKRPTGIWRSELNKARAIRDGKAGPKPIMLPVLWEFPEKLQSNEAFWKDRKNWPLVLPNLNRSIDAQRLEDDYVNNGSVGLQEELTWVSQHLNIEIGVGATDDRWVGSDYWTAAARPEMDLDYIIQSSGVCVVGIDGGGLDDLLGMAVLGRHAETKTWQHWARAWADRDVLTLRKSIASSLLDLEETGDLVLVDNLEMEAVPELVEICARLRDAGVLPDQDGIGMDPEGVGAIVDGLIARQFQIEDIRSISQGYKLNNAIKTAPVKLKNGSMVHCGQHLMEWCVGNARTEARGNAVIVTKAQSGTAKIDPLMALFDAVQLMSWNPVAARSGTYLEAADLMVL
jgi:phage terminase large subunit-like protein